MQRDIFILAALAIGLVLALGCNRKPAPGGAAPAAAPQVTVVKPEKRGIQRVIELPGTVMPFEETSLFAKYQAYVGAIAEDPDKLARIAKNGKDWPAHDRFIDIGSRVQQGQVLAELYDPEREKEWKQKQALIKQAESEVVQAEKFLASTDAAVAAANSAVVEAEAGVKKAAFLVERWQSEVDRITKFIGEGVDVKQTLDETRNQFKAAGAAREEADARVITARAAVRKAEADRGKAAADIEAAKARLEVARADAERADAMLSYLKIRSPFDGIVTARGVMRGDLVASGDQKPLFGVARIDPVRVVVHVPEVEAGLVAEGQTVRMSLQDAPGGEATGKVVRTSWSLQPGSRTLRTEIDLPNKDAKLRPGTYAFASLEAELPAAWAVPAAAIGKVNDEPVIYLVENGKAVRATAHLLHGDAKFTQIQRYKKPGAKDWTDLTGNESIATPAVAVADGQAVSN